MTFAEAAAIAKESGCAAEIYADRVVVTRNGRLIWLKADQLALDPDAIRKLILFHLPPPAA